SDVLDKIRFTDPGWADQNHILLNVFGLLGAPGVFFLKSPQIVGVVVMIANRDREHFLRFVLLDDKTVKMRFDVARQKIEFELGMVGLLRLFILNRGGWFWLGKRRHRDPIAEVLFHELRDLGLQLFRCMKW